MREFLAQLIEPEAVRRERRGAFPQPLELRLRLACYRAFLVAALAASLVEGHLVHVGAAFAAALVAHFGVDRGLLPTLQRNAIAMLSLLALLPIAVTTCAAVVEGAREADPRGVLLELLTHSLVILGVLLHLGHKGRLEYRGFLVLSALGLLLALVRGDDRRLLLACFLYVAFLSQALVLYGRWREHERRRDRTSAPDPFHVAYPRGRHEGSHALRPALQFAMHGIVLATALFLAFPKSSGRRVVRTDEAEPAARSEGRVTGFSEDLSLGAAGELKQNWEPALVVHGSGDARLRSLEELVLGSTPYWRGMAYAHYDEGTGTWRSPDVDAAIPLRDGGARDRDGQRDGWIHWRRSALENRTTVEYEVELRLARSRVLFGLQRTSGVRLDPRDAFDAPLAGTLREGTDETLFFTAEDGSGALTEGARYVLRSEPEVVLPDYPEDLRTAATPEPVYRRVPPTIAFDRRFRNLVEHLQENLRRDHRAGSYSLDALQREVVGYLQSNYPYRLGLLVTQSEDRDPVLRFLKAPQPQRGGSCTYFASSMVMILRSLGVSARIVSGFAGYVPSGATWIVAQAHAHTWVEVYCGPNDGWVAMDPTPPQSVPQPPQGVRDALAAAASEPVRPKEPETEEEAREEPPPWIDRVAASLRDYDRTSRDELFADLAALVHSSSRALLDLLSDPLSALPWLAGGLLLLVLWCLRILRRRSPEAARRRALRDLDPRQRSLVTVYDDMLRLLRARGIGRTPAMTARDLLELVGERLGHAARGAVERVTFLFEDIRYGGAVPDDGELADARRQLDVLRRGRPLPN